MWHACLASSSPVRKVSPQTQVSVGTSVSTKAFSGVAEPMATSSASGWSKSDNAIREEFSEETRARIPVILILPILFPPYHQLVIMGYSSLRTIFADRFGQQPARYSRVKSDDPHDPELSGMRRTSSPRHWREAWKSPLLVLGYAVLTSAITCLAMWSFPPACRPRPNEGPLLKTPVPEFPKEIRMFEMDSMYSDPPTPENNEAWNDLLPFGRGYVFVEDAADYGLEPGIVTEYGEIYSVAMYHQMHCLGLVRRNFWRLVDGILHNRPGLTEEARAEIEDSHTGHCFDYFRQSFECSADMSLEWPRTETDGRRFQVDGAGIPHVCASKVSPVPSSAFHSNSEQKALKDYMDFAHFNNSHNNDIAA
ncbi:mannosylphosphorylation protein (Mnn4) [Purpureocillium lavendulum]|uniref:Mannosylphosphorylation protein (Mnn4) n=1 Tax=Purpureocillium lavendulum TaxID=1247861 RepID=A0AB34FSZ2_9HYPO|nr:mannosylphosphorylation protein (Mnn4) [Purpureocillium lavendulum]